MGGKVLDVFADRFGTCGGRASSGAGRLRSVLARFFCLDLIENIIDIILLAHLQISFFLSLTGELILFNKGWQTAALTDCLIDHDGCGNRGVERVDLTVHR